jgi:D-3-phosphoglycerate dehydrogenase
VVGRCERSQTLILLTHTDGARDLYYGPRALAELQALGEVRLNQTGAPLLGDGLIAAAQGAQIIVADRAVPAPAGVFAALPDLVAFCRGAVDIRTVDVAAATAAGVLVTQASPGFVSAVCELIIGLAVDLCRGVSASVASFRVGVQPPVRMGRQIAGSTVGIVGYGAIGRELARLMQAFGATVLVADPYATDVETVPLAAMLARSDLVVCLAVANAETVNLMDNAAFATMRRGSLFINASRGELVDDAALADALDRGHLAGAALDVGRAPDQMPSAGLAQRADVLATPHIGGLTRAAADHQALETVRQVASILAGTVPDGAVNAIPGAALPKV